jgi:hypothetical protein
VRYFLKISFLVLLSACTPQPEHHPATAFYFWRSAYILNEAEHRALSSNNCHTNFIKYFDIVREGNTTKPVAILKLAPSGMRVVPVIFIENKVFANMTFEDADALFVNTCHLIDTINRTHNIRFHQIQIDCDWTESTKDLYFYFLKRFANAGVPLSATIRLHQIKYKERTGIPPVHKGVLMYYNMGTIAAESANSIYDEGIAKKYTSYLKDYPLTLDLPCQYSPGEFKFAINRWWDF